MVTASGAVPVISRVVMFQVATLKRGSLRMVDAVEERRRMVDPFLVGEQADLQTILAEQAQPLGPPVGEARPTGRLAHAEEAEIEDARSAGCRSRCR